MKRSDDITELAAALSAAQGDFEEAARSAKNPHLKNKYADLASVVEVMRKPFAANGLAVSQPMRCENGHVIITTLLFHTSGQWIEEELALPVVQAAGINLAQAIGSASTYARRYALMSMVGVAPGEDDGASAGPPAKEDQPVPPPREPQPMGPSLSAQDWVKKLSHAPTLKDFDELKTSTAFTTFWRSASKPDREHVSAAADHIKAELSRPLDEEEAKFVDEREFYDSDFLNEVAAALEELDTYEEAQATIERMSRHVPPSEMTNELKENLQELAEEVRDREAENPPPPPKEMPKHATASPEYLTLAENAGYMAGRNGDPDVIPESYRALDQKLGDAWHKGWQSARQS